MKTLTIITLLFLGLLSIQSGRNTSTSDCEQERQQLEANKKLVTDMYQEVFGDKNIDALNKYLVKDYIQHNPTVADGRQALEDALKVWFKGAPKEKIDIQHIGADGNFVYLHTRRKSGDKTLSIVDIFKVINGKITEHWDVIQQVPEKSANDHPMF